MRLSEFITSNIDRILAQWDENARTMTPAASDMSMDDLRDHAREMLVAVALDIETPQTNSERRKKSLGESDNADASNAAAEHGSMRHDSQFTLVQLHQEFRALRASVLQMWLEHVDGSTREALGEVMRFNEAIDQAVAESILTYADRAAYARDMFDAILGHDLRGPLSSMAMAGEVLSRQALTADRASELGRRVASAARYMTSMVNDLMEFTRSRLGGGALPIHPRTVSITDVCRDALHDARAMHPQHEFDLVAAASLEACVDTDRMHQLLVNLLGNAGQHGAPGRPIQLRVDGTDDEALLCVTNEGARIPADSLKRIFEPMVRLNPGSAASNGAGSSLGLGLHIAREIAEGHGGSISAHSNEVHTTFTVRLPRQGHSQSARA